jgi:putative glycosyltransferase
MAGFEQLPMRVRKVSQSPTTYSPLRLVRLFINNVTSFSVRPLIGMFLLGAIILVAAIAMIIGLAIQRLLFGIGVPGWASIMAIVLLSSGLTIFLNGVMAVYIATIFLEVKRRPRSIARAVVRHTDN